ncbi:MAG: twin-arginine translocation signal domain-containing protein [Chrysiogenales bacterium]|nr:MAG: twin-arginine translocation signal domain-containing protein [Chrysiogenales bacterium]
MYDEMQPLNRRDFLKLSATAAAAAAIPGFAGCASPGALRAPDIDYSGRLILGNCNVVDVIGGRVIRDRDIVIEKGRIISIAPSGATVDGVRGTIDARGAFLLPGLIDAHCHLTIQSCAAFRLLDVSKYVRQIKTNGMMQVAAGVTTVRDTGGFPKMLHDLVRDYEKGSLTGPRVVYCNAIANIDGGHPDIKSSDVSAMGPITMAFTGSMTLDFTDRRDLMKKLAENVEHGASFVKISMDNRSLICGRGAIAVYDDDDLKAIFDFAEKKGMPVAAHTLMHYGMKRVLNYPINSLEHITGDADVADGEIDLMRKKGVVIVPTLQIGHNFAFRERYAGLPERYATPFIENELRIKYDYLSRGNHGAYDPHLHRLNMESIGWFRDPGCEEMPNQKKYMTDPEIGFEYLVHGPSNARRMKDAGVLMGCGTDSGVPCHYHGSLWREMEFMSRAGFSSREIVRMATADNAAIIGMKDSIGRIEEGMRADLALFREDPLMKIEALRDPLLVLIDGRVKAGGDALRHRDDAAGVGHYAL